MRIAPDASGDFSPPSPPAEKATASGDQAGQTRTSDGARNRSGSAQQHVVETFRFRSINEFAANLEFSHIPMTDGVDMRSPGD